MDTDRIITLGRQELVMKLGEYNQCLKMISELLKQYGSMSNDDLIGLIADAMHEDFK